MDIWKFVALLLVGGLSGAVGALCGVGGGIIMVPVLTLAPLFFLEQKQAVATSLCVIIITSALATGKNWNTGYIQWWMVLPLALGSMIVTWFAADYLKTLSNDTLVKIFGVVMILAGISMLVLPRAPKKVLPPSHETAP